MSDPKGAKAESAKRDLLTQVQYLASKFRPSVIIDSHMHIESIRCAPMPSFFNRNWISGTLLALWGKVPYVGRKYLPPTRYVIENLDKIAGYATMVVVKYGGAIALNRIGVPTAEGVQFLETPAREAGEKVEKEVQHIGVVRSIKLGQNKTFDIGKQYIIEQQGVVNELNSFMAYQGQQVDLVGMLMPMDMEYAHIDGYFGVKIYNGIYEKGDDRKINPIHYWYPYHGLAKQLFGGKGGDFTPVYNDPWNPGKTTQTLDPSGGSAVYDHVKKDKGVTIEYGSGLAPAKVKIDFTPCLLHDEETKKYETWNKQLKETELSVLTNSLKVIPLFHYDPRRWEEVNRDRGGTTKGLANLGNDVPFAKVTQGFYAGFKIYTAQGYRPYDVSRLPVLYDFYKKCEQGDIPIMNHCTPEGMVTVDREEYITFTHPADDGTDRAEKAPYLPDDKTYLALLKKGIVTVLPPPKGEEYFNDNFVAPDAWKPVLEKWPKLRLCLAHFGGNTELGRTWSRQIIELMKKYDYLYSDISSSFADNEPNSWLARHRATSWLAPKPADGGAAGFRDYFKETLAKNPILKKRILFGTDWYMTKMGKVEYLDYYKATKKFFDDYDTSLWVQFTLINPARFYKFNDPKTFDRLITAIEKLAPKVSDADIKEYDLGRADLAIDTAELKRKSELIRNSYAALKTHFETCK